MTTTTHDDDLIADRQLAVCPPWCADAGAHGTDTCRSVQWPAGEGRVWLSNDQADQQGLPNVAYIGDDVPGFDRPALNLTVGAARTLGARLIELADTAEKAAPPWA